MRPEQKVVLSCRQTGEKAERLLEWLDQSKPMLKCQGRALRIEVQGMANELLSLVEAVEQPPTAGLIGAWGSARAELVCALMSDTPPPTGGDEQGRLNMSRERLVTLFPRDSDGGTAAALRLVPAERAEAPFRFPIRLTLLGQLDVVKIIASAYLLHVPPRRQATATPELIATRLTLKAQEMTQQAFSGISRRDIDSLRDTLHCVVPASQSLRRIDASGYWDTLSNLIPHLPEAARRRAFALLWGEDQVLTELFEKLSDAIELLGFSAEAFSGLDAIIGRDQTSGWAVRHPDSVIAAGTILGIQDGVDSTVRISSRHGRTNEVQRCLLAALMDECCVPVATVGMPLLETAELLVLPAPRPVMLWPNAKLEQSVTPPATRGLSTIEALEIFAAQKATYLVDRAVRRFSLTSLLVATDLVDGDIGREIDAASTAQVANWVGNTQGDTPHARERRRTGLCILVAEFPGASATIDPVLVTDGTDARLAATVEAVLDNNGEWAKEWTPNRPFRNVFSWRPPRSSPLSPPIVGQPGSADILRFDRVKGSDGGLTSQVAELASTHDLVNLRHALLQATSMTVHQQQLSARLVELRRTLSARFLRLHISSDPSIVVEWRRQICHVVRNRLEQSARNGTFGKLQKALMFTEVEALAVLARLKADGSRFDTQATLDLRSLDPGRIVENCLEAWVAAMRQATRSPILMRAMEVPGSIVAHMIDELVLGALRIGLQEKLSEAVRRIQLSAVRSVDCESSIAALMERGINAYVEALDPGARTLRNPNHRDTRFGMGSTGGSAMGAGEQSRSERSRLNHDGNGSRRRPASTAASSVAEDWAETFADLIEANILGAGLLGGAGQLNRELGEVLNAMSASPFEGFQ